MSDPDARKHSRRNLLSGCLYRHNGLGLHANFSLISRAGYMTLCCLFDGSALRPIPCVPVPFRAGSGTGCWGIFPRYSIQ